MELLSIYIWTIAAGMIAAGALALIGCQLASKDKSMQTLCVGQGAMLGVLLGIGMGPAEHGEVSEWLLHARPFALAVVVSLLIGMLGLLIERTERAAKNTYFIAIFAVILSLNHLVTALFPSLESHMAQVFFGDLATLSSFDVWLTMSLSALCLLVQILCWRISSNRSFEQAILGAGAKPYRSSGWKIVFVDGLTFLFVCYSVQFLGFLFTTAALFIPTVALSVFPAIGLGRHLINAFIVAALGVGVGFLGSLSSEILPTVPTIALTMLVIGLIASVGCKICKNN